MPSLGFPRLAAAQAVSAAMDPMTELRRADQYDEIDIIGNGAYGTVYKARDTRNEGQVVALKKIRIPTSNEDGMPISTLREVAMLKQLENFEHPNIIRLLDVCPGCRNNTEMRLVLVFEYIDQDLDNYLKRCPSPGLGPDKIRDLMYQILRGVDFLHTNRIIHRDLKPQNVLVTSAGQVKLADFGLARVYGFQNALTTVVVTLWYRAPEVLLQAQYATAVDLWSCGCIFAELHMRRALFSGQSDIDQLYKIFDIMGLPPREEWPECVSLPWSAFRPTARQPIENFIPEMENTAKEFLLRLLEFSQGRRISAQEALKHSYFSDYESEHSIYDASSQNSSLSSASSDAIADEDTDTSNSLQDRYAE